MTIESHIKTISILHIVHSAILALIGLFVFFLLAGVGVAVQDETAMLVLSIVGVVVGVLLILVAIPGVVGAIGLMQYRPWGRILTLIVSFLKLVDIPIGTALGVYSIVILFRDDVVAFIEGGAGAPSVPAVPIVPETPRAGKP
jgi:hypothetical protein